MTSTATSPATTPPRALWRLVAAFALTLGVVAAWSIFAATKRYGEIAFLPGLALLVVSLFFVLPARPVAPPVPRAYAIAGALIAAAIGLFFRLRYLWTVPVGWDFEPLAFVFFARKLVAEGFPYIPYAWYAHTLYSYFIALAMLVCPTELIAFRVASAILSIATLGALYLCLRRLINAQAAWVGTALLGASYWHMFASRNGYHQLLLPLFQLLFVYGLVRGLEGGRVRDFWVAIAAMVVGLHAYWGFYLMPPMWVAFLLYLYFFHRELFRRSLRPMMAAAGIAALLAVPLVVFYYRHTDIFGYILQGFSLQKSEAVSFSAKVIRNLRFVLWDLSGYSSAYAEHGPVIHDITAPAALLGLAVSLRRFARSVPHALVVLLLLVNVAGLAVTIANGFYVIATLAAVFCLAAIGIAELMQSWEQVSRWLTPVVFVVAVTAVCWQAQRNYGEFFDKRIDWDLKVPYRPPGAMYVLLDEIREAVKTRAVYVPRDEPGRDFDAQLFALGERVPSYRFIRRTIPYDVGKILFPAAEVLSSQGVEILLPNAPFVDRVVLPILGKLYPHLAASRVAPPEPYRSRNATAVAFRIEIPHADVARYQGLRQPETGRRSVAGLLSVPGDGRYHFRNAAGSPAQLSIDERQIALEGTGEGPEPGVLLEGGLHPIRVAPLSQDGEATFEWRKEGTIAWGSLDPYLLNDGGQSPEVFAPYLARPGEQASFSYIQRQSISPPAPPREAWLEPSGAFEAVGTRALWSYDPQGHAIGELGLPGPRDYRVARLGGELVALDPNGILFDLSGGVPVQAGQIACKPVDYVVDGERLIVLCSDSRLLATAGSQPSMSPLLGPDRHPLVRPADLARAPGGFYVVDAGAGWLLQYDRRGHLRRSRVVGHLYWESDVETDAEGNLYLKRRGQGTKTYSPDGSLLFNPRNDRPCLFSGPRGEDVDTISIARFKFAGRYAAAVAPFGKVVVYERHPAG